MHFDIELHKFTIITPLNSLRHAKHVSDQTARERVLNTEPHVPVAAIAANPVLPMEKTKIRLKCKLV